MCRDGGRKKQEEEETSLSSFLNLYFGPLFLSFSFSEGPPPPSAPPFLFSFFFCIENLEKEERRRSSHPTVPPSLPPSPRQWEKGRREEEEEESLRLPKKADYHGSPFKNSSSSSSSLKRPRLKKEAPLRKFFLSEIHFLRPPCLPLRDKVAFFFLETVIMYYIALCCLARCGEVWPSPQLSFFHTS